VYYFESVLTPNTFWVDFKNIDFSEKATVKKLNLTGGEIYAGDAVKKFTASAPFKFAGL
jgi:choloylglycine hydrolase